MKKTIAVALVAAVGAIATPARAAPARAADEGFQLALRAGYGIPMGDADGGTGGAAATKLSDAVKGKIPLQLDVGYRFAKNWFVGGYFEYGFGSLNKDVGKVFEGCDTGGVSCSSYSLRFGAEVAYNFMPGESFQPWVGVGTGYEKVHASVTPTGGTSQDVDLKGWEYFNIQVGGDFMVSPMFSVGPFVMFGLGQYSTITVANVDVPNLVKGTHEWLTFGLKGTFNL